MRRSGCGINSDVQQANGKELVLAFLTIAAGFANAYLWQEVIVSGEFRSAAFYSLPVVALFVFAVLFGLAAAFIASRPLRIGTGMLSLAAGYLLAPPGAAALAAGAASVAGGWYAVGAIASEEANATTFAVRKIFRSGLPVFFTAVALLFAAIYHGTLSARPDQSIVPRTFFDAVIPFIEPALSGILPGFHVDASVDDFLLAFAASRVGGEVDLAELGPAERNALLREGREALTRDLGIELTGEERSGDLLYRLTNAQIEKLLGPFRSYLPLIAAAGFFLAVKALTWPLYWATLLLLFGVIQLLQAAGVITRETRMIQVERLRLH